MSEEKDMLIDVSINYDTRDATSLKVESNLTRSALAIFLDNILTILLYGEEDQSV